MNKKITTLLKMIVLALGILAVCIAISKKGIGKKGDTGVTYNDFAMGTSVSVTIHGSKESQKISDEIVLAANNLSNNLISWRESGSELATLNTNYNAGEKYVLSDELYKILQSSYDICVSSKGALDITVRPLANLWNIENASSEDFSIPPFEDIADTRKLVGYDHIEFTDDGIIIDQPDMILDLGATGKGYALDLARGILEGYDMDGAIVTMGGSVLIYGKKSDGSDWKVGIRNPQGNEDDMIGYLCFEGKQNICISTSGDYEKYIDKDGYRYHHIFDAATGFPAETGLSSVTVVCENGLLSDGLSTACYVLGYDNSLPLLEQYGADAVFVFRDNTTIVTEGLYDIYVKSE